MFFCKFDFARVFAQNPCMTDDRNEKLETRLRALIETLDVADALTEPLTESIENLLTITAAELHSEEASVIIRDGSLGDLRFLTAVGKVADQLKNVKIPAGKGVAGFVFSSGQPMAVADVGDDATFYSEVDRQTGYRTDQILATPLRFNGEIIGVLEYVNRTGEPPFQPFSPQEMDKASLFAEVIASLVNSYEAANVVCDLSEKILFSEKDAARFEDLRGWLTGIRQADAHREMLELALLVREIAKRGERERLMCREILESIRRFADNQEEMSFLRTDS